MEKVRLNGITEGVIWKELLKFSAPLLIGNLFQQLYNTVDSVIVGNYVGSEALAAVGSSVVIINMVIGFFMGIATGAGVLLSQYYGAKDERGVQNTIHTAITALFISGLIVTIVGVLMASTIIDLMKTPEEVRELSILYLRIFFLGGIPLVIYNAGAGLLRAVGDAKRPLYYLIVSSIVNIVLDFVFVIYFDMGVAGVAVATIIAETVSAILVMRVLMTDNDIYKVQLSKLKIQKNYLSSIMKVGLPAGIQQSVISFSNVIVQANINVFGAAAVAGAGAYNKVDAFVMLPFMSLSLASTTFIGQNIGAKKWDRVKKSAHSCFAISTGITIFLSILLFLFGTSVMRIFTDDAEVIRYGTLMMKWMAPFYFICSFTNVCSGVIRGAGEATIPMLIMVGNFCGLRMIWLAVTTKLIGNIHVVFACYVVTWITAAIMMVIYYNKGNWLRRYTESQNI